MSTPYSLAVSFAMFGKNHNYRLIQVNSQGKRGKGRDFNLQNQLLFQTADILKINYLEVDKSAVVDEILTSNDEILIDYRINEVIASSKEIASNLSRQNLDFGNVTFVTNAADMLQGNAPVIDFLRGPRFFKDYLAWKKAIRSYHKATFLFPGFKATSKYCKRHSNVIFIDRDFISAKLLELSRTLVRTNFPELNLDFNSRINIINPNAYNLSINHLNEISQEINLNNVETDFSIIKFHPATEDLFNKNIFVFDNLKANLLNLVWVNNVELLSAFPLEFMFIAFPNSNFIGFPSTACSILSKNRFKFIFTGNRNLDSEWFRNGREFEKLLLDN